VKDFAADKTPNIDKGKFPLSWYQDALL